MNDVTTYHVDSSRSGVNSGFPFAPVGGTWRRYVKLPTNAAVRAAPLYLAGFTFTAGSYAGETHDVVIIAASDNVVYAYAEDQLLSGSVNALWVQQSLGLASPRTGSNIPPPVGICSTPVIDRTNAAIYVIAYVHESSNDVYKIFALDLNTGHILDRATLNDPGAAGRPTFDSTKQDQRGGLNLVNGWIFMTFADFLAYDADRYHGWVVACNQANLSQQLFLSDTTNNTIGGGAWGPGGAAAAADGSLYVSTGNAVNPTYLAGNRPKPGDYFEGVIHVQLTGAPGLKVLDVYQPTWAKVLNDGVGSSPGDLDFGGSSPIVLPPIGGKQFVVTTAKDGNIYMLGSTLPGFGGELWSSVTDKNDPTNGSFFSSESKCCPAYFHDPVSGDHYVYVVGSGSPGLAAFRVDALNQKLLPAWNAGISFGDGPGSPFVIADPTTQKALVWVVDGVDGTPAVLRAFDAVSGALVFHSDAVPGNAVGHCPHFAPITGAGKSVFVGTDSGVISYVNVGPTILLLIIQDTFGQNEVELGLPGIAKFSSAGYVQLDGFSPKDVGNLGNPTTVPTFTIALDPTLPAAVAAAIGQMGVTAVFTPPVVPLDSNLPDAPQGFLFPFTVSFNNDKGFIGMRDAKITSTLLTLTANMTVGGANLSNSGQIELTTGEDPRFVNINPTNPAQFPSWLSFDLRFFKVAVPPGKTIHMYGTDITDAASAPSFIANAIKNFNSATFDGLPQDEKTTEIEFLPTDNDGKHVFNFAVARVRLRGKNPGIAKAVRVFFRLFNAQTTASTFNPNTAYKTFSDGIPYGHKIPQLGIENGEYRTIPCFATPRVNLTDHSKSMDQQTDSPNVQNLATIPGVETDYFFGCWLDVNQYNQRFLPSKVPSVNPNNGPWNGVTLQSLQEAFSSAPHQCLIAEINFDEIPIPLGANSGTSDKLAQRNIAWIDGPNPGIVASRLMPHPVQVRPTKPTSRNPDELMILWGSTPQDSKAQLYLPSLSADEILRLADRRYSVHRLRIIDAHTIGCPTGGATFIPLPEDTALAAGLLTIGLPENIRKGDAYTITVRQLTDARAVPPPSPPPPPRLTIRTRNRAAVATHELSPPIIDWRRVAGAFQFNLVISTKEQLLLSEERLLAVLRWMELKMPKTKSWYPVLVRYIDQVAGRVLGFGGDPGQIKPSPTGDVGPNHRPHRHKEQECEERRSFTGKPEGLIFDRFGDFEGFILDTEDGDHKFFSREKEIEELAERAWRERLRITVWVEHDEPHRPLSIVVRQPPVPF
ncbi:MAG TPA: hypothetical protein VN670_10025 [Acidobacteriaceae bacterium]|nr:hypothetical protein [Acidobacteriaceae bacterium]